MAGLITSHTRLLVVSTRTLWNPTRSLRCRKQRLSPVSDLRKLFPRSSQTDGDCQLRILTRLSRFSEPILLRAGSLSSRLGEARFSYHGTNAGVDVITVTLGNVTKSVTNTWLSANANLPPVVSTTNTLPIQIGLTLLLSGTVSDDGQPIGAGLNVHWQLLDGPGDVIFENADQVETHATCSVPGTYRFEFTADDSQFSSRSVVEVKADLVPTILFPWVEIPPLIAFGTPVELAADADDPDGTISRVEFYANDTLVGAATTDFDYWNGYNITWTPPTNGWFQLRAVAYDNLGSTSTSDVASVQVDFLPTVSIDNIATGTIVTAPTNAVIHAAANDPDGTIASLSIYVNGEPFGTTTNGDLSVTWFPRRAGDYTLSAAATDDLGLTTTSEYITVTVTGVFPQIVITNPAAGFVLPYGKPMTIMADVSISAPSQITNVSFFTYNWADWLNPVELIGSVTQPPYTVEWRPVGGYYSSITAVAYSDSGLLADAVITGTLYPDASIAFAEPANGQTVLVGKPQPIRLEVHDPWSIFTGFNYYVNGEFLIQTTNAEPVMWTPDVPGNYNLYAENIYPFTFRARGSVIAINPALENVTIVSPADGDTLYAGITTSIAISFDDATGAFDHFEMFTNGVSLGQTTNTVFGWMPFQTNDYVLTAKVFDHDGYAYDSINSVTVHVVTAPRPVVTITSPVEGGRVRAGAETVVIADLDDLAGITTNVQFYVDGLKVADNTTYFSWTPTQIGSHGLQAVALTSDGDSISSSPVNVMVVVMYSPVVTLLSPTNNQHFVAGTLPTLSAQATDADGSITNLSLMLDATVLGSTNDVALTVPVTSLTPGWHTATATATDNDGLSTSASAVTFYVDRQPNLTLPVPDQLAAQSLSATEIQLAWVLVATNELTQSMLIERWDAAQSLWTEIGETAAGNTNYTDSALNPGTNYRYRVACVDTNGNRSAYSAEANATTRTVVPNYTVIDLTAAIAGSLTNLATGGNILTNGELTHYDLRRTVPTGAAHATAVLGANAAPLALAVARFKERWPQIQLDYDPVLLAPKSILPRLGFLTGPGGSGVTVSDATAQMFDPNDPHRPVKAFLQEQSALFGFNADALTSATVQRDYVSPGTGARTVVWQQQVAGVPVFNALMVGHITAAGELATLSSEFIPAPVQAADPSVVAAVAAGCQFPVSGAQALLTAVTNVGDLFSFSDFSYQTDPQGVTQSQSFSATKGIKDDAHAELTWFPASRNELKLAWQVIFTSQWRDEMVLTVVSALDNQILYRRNLTADSSDASYRVYLDRSPAPMSPGLPVPGTAQAPTIDRSLVTFSALDPIASPNGWINDGDNETRGNNVDAHLDRNDDNVSDSPRLTGNPWRVFNCTLDLFGSPDNYGNAAVTQLFFWDNWMHDTLYGLGFTEPAGNFQNDNFGRGGLGGDAVQADAQDGASLNDGQHHNNANMSTPPDGYAPRMQMYVFNGVTPARDGSLDAEIVLHEYTHGLSSRLIGGGAGIDALQTAGMGEGWSDFYALALLASPTNDADATYPVGAYASYHGFGSAFEENYYYGIRHYPYCTDTNKNPLTFADIDPARASAHAGVPRSPLLGAFQASQASEVHGQGEVWAMMLWEMRANLIHQYGAEAGNNLALQLVTEGLRLSPPNPNFVQARDAILLADRMVSGGVNAPEIWVAFAKRGLGYNAKCPESYTTTGVQASYELMPALATELVEVQTASGAVEPGGYNPLLIHVRNQGNAAATHITGQLSTTVPGVTVVQNYSTYADIPPGGSQANAVAFQLQTGGDYVAGTPIDLVFVITADQGRSTNYLRLFTGVPGAEILFDNSNVLADPQPADSGPKDLTPWDLGNAEPLWMADDADVSCLLKVGDGRYALWRLTKD